MEKQEVKMEIEKLTEEALKNAGDYETLEKGRVYFSNGSVRRKIFSEYGIAGEVFGNHGVYYPILFYEKEKLSFRCTCGKKEMCKHVVALGLSWIYERNNFKTFEEILSEKDEREKAEVIKKALFRLPGFLAFI
jgi:uncharacterized Zn finger protein